MITQEIHFIENHIELANYYNHSQISGQTCKYSGDTSSPKINLKIFLAYQKQLDYPTPLLYLKVIFRLLVASYSSFLLILLTCMVYS